MEKWDGAKDIKKSKYWKELLFALIVNEKVPIKYYYKNINKKYQVISEDKLYILLEQINTKKTIDFLQKKGVFWKETILIMCLCGDLSYKTYKNLMYKEDEIFTKKAIERILNIETLKK